MSTFISTTALAGLSSPTTRSQGNVTFIRVLRSEWIKLRTVRSSVVLIGVSIAGMVAVSVASAAGIMAGYTGPTELANAQSVQGLPTVGLYLGQLVLAALGVLIISSDYMSGVIRPTFTGVPQRISVLLAKGVLAGLIGGVVGLAGRIASYIGIQPILAQHGLDFPLGSAEFWTSVAGAAIYLALIAVMAVGVGALVRNSAAGIVIMTGILFVAPMILWFIPGDLAANLVNYLPSEAGTQLMLTTTAPGDLTQLEGGLLLSAWAVLPFMVAMWTVKGRDV